MSEDKDLLARIGQLAGHINLHKASPSTPHRSASESRVTKSFAPTSSRNHALRRPYGRGRGTYRRGPRNHSLILTNNRSVELQNTDAATSDISDGRENLSPSAAYVTKHGRHNQLINASVFEKVTQQRKQNIEESQQSKVLRQDQWERSQMHQYLESLGGEHVASNTQKQSAPGGKVHEIAVDGLIFQILKGGTKLGRIYGPADKSRPTPKSTIIHGVTFVRSKQGNLYRSGIVRACK
ncbi:MAG: hypothetical protein Q9222_001169 [Ikaeria aurantiellina]